MGVNFFSQNWTRRGGGARGLRVCGRKKSRSSFLNISLSWSHLTVIFWNLMFKVWCRMAVGVQDHLECRAWKSVKVCDCILVVLIEDSSRLPVQDLGLSKGERVGRKSSTCPDRNLSEASLLMSPFQDPLQELSSRMTCCHQSRKYPPKDL